MGDLIKKWTLEVANKPTLVFSAEDYDDAFDQIFTQKAILSDLTCFDTPEGKRLWSGDKSDLHLRKANSDEIAHWSRSRKEAVEEGVTETDNEDWLVFLVPVVDSTDD